jgi:hypothetical protein
MDTLAVDERTVLAAEVDDDDPAPGSCTLHAGVLARQTAMEHPDVVLLGAADRRALGLDDEAALVGLATVKDEMDHGRASSTTVLRGLAM